MKRNARQWSKEESNPYGGDVHAKRNMGKYRRGIFLTQWLLKDKFLHPRNYELITTVMVVLICHIFYCGGLQLADFVCENLLQKSWLVSVASYGGLVEALTHLFVMLGHASLRSRLVASEIWGFLINFGEGLSSLRIYMAEDFLYQSW